VPSVHATATSTGDRRGWTAHQYAEAASSAYEFFYVDRKRLIRRPHGQDHTERLVDGEWVIWSFASTAEAPSQRPRAAVDDDDDGYGLDADGDADDDEDAGDDQEAGEVPEGPAPGGVEGADATSLSVARLARLARKYVIADRLDQPLLADVRELRRRRRAWLAVVPPLNGGAPRRISPDSANCSRAAYLELLQGIKVPADQRKAGLEQLQQQAELGDERQRDRGTGAETRANYFAGAAGLTTTLVLANAGLLLGQDALDNALRWMAGLALLAASFCAIMTGLRALQASMVTFVRSPANSVSRVVQRRKAEDIDMLRCQYIAALLVSQNRNSVVADWKITRLQEARGWFGGVIAGVVVLTVLVLIQALL
jgi:hypothetical protein